MAHVKEEVIKLIKALPENSTLEDIHYHLYVREKVEHGLKDIEEGHIVSQEDAEKRVEGWLKSSGRKQR
jgi:predicted transcriptional regulator